MQTATLSLGVFIGGRVIAGLGVGLISTLVPMYQSEWWVILFDHTNNMLIAVRSSPAWIRGAVVAAYQWAITIGLLLAAIANNSTQAKQDHSAWRIPIGIQFVWAAVLSGGMALLPEVGLPCSSSGVVLIVGLPTVSSIPHQARTRC